MYLVKQNLVLCNLSDSETLRAALRNKMSLDPTVLVRTFLPPSDFVIQTQAVARLQRSYLKMNDVKQMLVMLKSVSEKGSLPWQPYSSKMNE
jgi:hypothetical protein